jgi:hypothetical protein
VLLLLPLFPIIPLLSKRSTGEIENVDPLGYVTFPIIPLLSKRSTIIAGDSQTILVTFCFQLFRY